jgi:hypothetical protein
MITKADIRWIIDEMKIVFPTKQETIGKMDEISTKLDTFIGEIKSTRETQELHANDHARITHRIEQLEKHTRVTSLND